MKIVNIQSYHYEPFGSLKRIAYQINKNPDADVILINYEGVEKLELYDTKEAINTFMAIKKFFGYSKPLVIECNYDMTSWSKELNNITYKFQFAQYFFQWPYLVDDYQLGFKLPFVWKTKIHRIYRLKTQINNHISNTPNSLTNYLFKYDSTWPEYYESYNDMDLGYLYKIVHKSNINDYCVYLDAPELGIYKAVDNHNFIEPPHCHNCYYYSKEFSQWCAVRPGHKQLCSDYTKITKK
jgi:hypothetical protein